MQSSAETEADGDSDAIQFLRNLIAAQKGGEDAVQALISERLQASGCKVEVRPYDPALVPVIGEFAGGRAQTAGTRSNVIGTLNGDPSRRSLMMFAHPDSEPMSDVANWKNDPFAGAIGDGRLYGWGVADDLAGIAVGTLALIRAARAGQPLGTVVMISAPSKRHARGVAAAMHQGLTADAIRQESPDWRSQEVSNVRSARRCTKPVYQPAEAVSSADVSHRTR